MYGLFQRAYCCRFGVVGSLFEAVGSGFRHALLFSGHQWMCLAHGLVGINSSWFQKRGMKIFSALHISAGGS